jgi:predicted nuclease of predicted toxin-antitoxin system
MVEQKKNKKVISSILFFFINYAVATANITDNFNTTLKLYDYKTNEKRKIKDIFQMLDCSECCYPVDGVFCPIFYSSCLTEALHNNRFMFSRNTKLTDGDILQKIENNDEKITMPPVLMIRNKAVYLWEYLATKLSKELDGNIKKIQSEAKTEDKPQYAEILKDQIKLKYHKRITWKTEKRIISIVAFDFNDFKNVLTNYGIVLKLEKNAYKYINYYNINLYDLCKIKQISYTNTSIDNNTSIHNTNIPTIINDYNNTKPTTIINDYNNTKPTTIVSYYNNTTLRTSHYKNIEKSTTNINSFHNKRFNIAIILASVGAVIVIVIVIVFVYCKKIKKRNRSINKKNDNVDVSLYSIDMDQSLNLSEPHIYEDPYLMDQIEPIDDTIQYPINSTEQNPKDSDIIISSKNIGNNPIVILVEKENCQIIESCDNNTNSSKQSLLIKMPNKISNFNSSPKIKELLHLRRDNVNTKDISNSAQQNLRQADENNEFEEDINTNLDIYQPLYNTLESHNKKNNQELQNKIEDVNLTIDTIENNQNDFNTEQVDNPQEINHFYHALEQSD